MTSSDKETQIKLRKKHWTATLALCEEPPHGGSVRPSEAGGMLVAVFLLTRALRVSGGNSKNSSSTLHPWLHSKSPDTVWTIAEGTLGSAERTTASAIRKYQGGPG